MSDGVFRSGRWPKHSRGDDAVTADSLSAQRLREIEGVLGVAIDPSEAGLPQGREFERQAIELLRAFGRITDPRTRRDVLHLVQAASREA
ncbi:hypothetical protein [Methylobacterium sp. SyP6R]|uniref:hypothetical protein n=1 Tax=Methylobacterium sp. SyP6R TaxID=2718876 RepID=UPI001F481A5A|nr:hypothetical protein [Methylobacterium sp. SyP6R]MCF4127531.1 hypothetical protein [Methylobacterium sp. SyP6R]